MKSGTLSRSKAVQGGVRADKVVKEDKHGNEVVGRSKGRKALLGLVPSLELLVKAFDEIVGNIIAEALHTDMLYPIQRLDRHLIGEVTVTHNSFGCSQRLHGIQYGESLRTVSVAVKMKAEDKAGFAVQNEPEVVFLTLYLNNSFIGVPLVRVEIERRNELYGNVLEHGCELGAPVADGSVGDLDIQNSPQDQGDIAEGVLAQIEHAQGHEDHMNRIAHPFEVRLSEQLGHGWN